MRELESVRFLIVGLNAIQKTCTC